MKKTLVILTVMSCVVLFAGCGAKKEETTPNSLATGQTETDEQNQTVTHTTESQTAAWEQSTLQSAETGNVETQTEGTNETHQIEGYQMMDGNDVPVKISFTLEGIQKGEAAYKLLTEKNPDVAAPKDDEEYLIATFKISYDEGDADEIYLAENHASLQSASLYFALSNGDSNAEDMTEYLADSVYNLSIAKGESAQGSVAFLHKKDSIEPLYFLGFNNSISFDLSE